MTTYNNGRRSGKRNSKKPLLCLIGVGGLAVGAAAMWLSPQEQVVDVQRTRYASRDACLQDWNDPADCERVGGPGGASETAAASDTSGSTQGGGAHGSSSGGAHGGGWGGGSRQQANTGPYEQAAEKTADGSSKNPPDSSLNSPLDSANGKAISATSSEGGSGHSTSTTIVDDGGWYGPYYTRDGVVYHASGLRTSGVSVQHGTVSSLAVRESALSARSSAFCSTPRSVSVSEGRAISRGGFLSLRGGSGGHGGEGGGHGGGGGHGSGGG